VNWKASLFGAILVAVCGVAVGILVGGKKSTETVRRTVTSTVTTTASASTSATQPSTPTTTDTSTTGTSTVAETPENGQQYLAEYLAGQNSERLDSDASGVSLSNEPTKQELQGQTYQQAVVFNIDNSSEGDTASFQLPTPGFTRLTSKAIGLETISNAETYYRLTVYKNNDSSPDSVVLYQASFHGPSEVHKMDFELQSATDIVFVWTKHASEPDDQDVFILADPILTR
jgi:hypothetical protein